MAKRELRNLLAAVLAAATVAGCGGGGDGSPSPSGVALTGTVSAPGGTIAFNGPTFAERMFAWFTATPATAAMSGTSGVSGAAVKLIEIDATGAQVGSALATGTTGAGGSFTLTAPAGFTASAKYVVRATGTSGTLDSIVVSTSAQIDVDPSTDASVQIVRASVQGAGASLAALDTKAVAELVEQVIARLQNIDLTTATTATQIADAIKAEVAKDEEASNVAASLAASGVISGRVTDATGAALANIKVVALDYNDWVLRAATRTDASGNYTLHVPPSATQGYIVGAFNFTTASRAASEWYKAGGHGASPFQGDRVTVAAGTPKTIDMQLANGARISGTVTKSDTTGPLAGVRIMLRDLASGEPVTWTRTGDDGSYTINVPASLPAYVLADNFTLQAYGSGVYNGPQAGGATPVSGVVGIDRGTIVIPAAGSTLSANFTLIPGQKVAGTVTDGAASPTAVPGIAVRIWDNTGVFVTALRANLAGQYRVWLQPNAGASTAYVVRTRGQTASADLSADAVIADFNAAVNSKSAVLTSDGTTPVSQVKVQVYDATTNAFEAFEITNGDGSVTVYTDSASNVNKKLQAIVDGPQVGVGSGWYAGATSRGTATAVLFDGASLGTLTLPAGADLSGTVTLGGSPVNGDYIVQIFSGTVSTANFVATTRAQGDGSYAINLPTGAHQVRVCLWSAAPCTATPQAVTIANPPVSAVLDFAL